MNSLVYIIAGLFVAVFVVGWIYLAYKLIRVVSAKPPEDEGGE